MMISKLFQFVWDVRQEFAKVTWPSREELTGSTYIVIILTALLAVFIFAIDTLLNNFVQVLFG